MRHNAHPLFYYGNDISVNTPIVILSIAKDLNTSTLCIQILHFVQNDNSVKKYIVPFFYSFTSKSKQKLIFKLKSAIFKVNKIGLIFN